MKRYGIPCGLKGGRRWRDQRGFTLLESIAAIVIAGIVAVMLLAYFQSGITDSHRPALWLQEAVALNRIMENMNGTYRALPHQSLADLQNSIGAENSSQNNSFGIYIVLENHFIDFNFAGNEILGGPILKVSIRSATNPGYQLTQLFTANRP